MYQLKHIRNRLPAERLPAERQGGWNLSNHRNGHQSPRPTRCPQTKREFNKTHPPTPPKQLPTQPPQHSTQPEAYVRLKTLQGQTKKKKNSVELHFKPFSGIRPSVSQQQGAVVLHTRALPKTYPMPRSFFASARRAAGRLPGVNLHFRLRLQQVLLFQLFVLGG